MSFIDEFCAEAGVQLHHFTDWDVRGLADSDLWFKGPGWYYPDETGDLCGPYDTEEECSEALNIYVAHLSV